MVQFKFIGFDSSHGLFESQSAPAKRTLIVCRVLRAKGVAQPLKILHRAKGSSNSLKVLRPCLELIGWQIPGRANFIRSQAVEQVVLAVEDAQVRSKELIGRAG